MSLYNIVDQADNRYGIINFINQKIILAILDINLGAYYMHWLIKKKCKKVGRRSNLFYILKQIMYS